MRWSWKLGQLAGIGIYIHWSFLILVAWVLLEGTMGEGGSLASATRTLLFVLAVFGCIVLHELGHALAARRYGIATRDITLLPIGGLARLERMPDNPIQEFWVAVAGPAVNVVIAIVLSVLTIALHGAQSLTHLNLFGGEFLGQLALVNIVLVVFNLLPAFPMDGGRVLRALLAHATGNYQQATNIAATVGQAMAIFFGFLGLFGPNPFLLFIALFVFLGAQGESQMVTMREVFRGVPVRSAMITRYRVLSPHDDLGVAVQELLAGSQTDFPVVEGEQIVGMLPRSELIKSLAEGESQRRVADVMRNTCEVVEDSDMLDRAFQKMQDLGCSTIPVVHNQRLVGLLTHENIGEWIAIQSVLKQRQPA